MAAWEMAGPSFGVSAFAVPGCEQPHIQDAVTINIRISKINFFCTIVFLDSINNENYSMLIDDNTKNRIIQTKKEYFLKEVFYIAGAERKGCNPLLFSL